MKPLQTASNLFDIGLNFMPSKVRHGNIWITFEPGLFTCLVLLSVPSRFFSLFLCYLKMLNSIVSISDLSLFIYFDVYIIMILTPVVISCGIYETSFGAFRKSHIK